MGSLVAMEVDTAADYSIMSKSSYTQKFSNFPLYPSNVELKTYTGETLTVCGEMQCNVSFKDHEYTLPIIVANYENKPILLGRNLLNRIKLAWGEIFSLKRSGLEDAKSQLDLLAKHSDLLEDSYEGMKGVEAHITMKDGAKPIFIKPRRVPYALKDEVEREVDKLEKNGVIVKTEKSQWTSPIIVVPKGDKSVGIYGDYKITINSAVEDEQYPLPTQQDLYAALSG